MTLILILGHWPIGCKCGVGSACSMKDILHRAQSFNLSSSFLFLPVFPLVSLQVCVRSGATRWRWSLLKLGRKWRFRGRSCSGWTLPDSVKSKIWQISHASMRPLSYTIYERDTIQDSYMWVFPFSQSCFPHVFSNHLVLTHAHDCALPSHECVGFLWVSEKDSVTHTDMHVCVCSSKAHGLNFCPGFI